MIFTQTEATRGVQGGATRGEDKVKTFSTPKKLFKQEISATRGEDVENFF